ncbi:MAG: hypothetical protein V4495_14900 [Pseudomonadota bacterium]
MDEIKNKNLLQLIFSLIESRYIRVPEINDLAKALNELDVRPELWLIELSACETTDEAQDILLERISEHHVVFDERYVSLLLGFLYLGVQEGKITLSEFEADLVDVIDAYSDCINMTIEDFHRDFFSLNSLPDQNTVLGSYLIDSAEKSKTAFCTEITPLLDA